MSRDVFDIGHILETPLDLETRDASVDELLQVSATIHIAQGKEMAVAHKYVAVGILKIERKSAELSALATVGTAVEESLAGIAPAAKTNAKSAMNERLETNIGTGAVNLSHLLDGQFAGKDNLLETAVAQFGNTSGGAIVHLRAGMEGDGR